jgi:hypothetical protein
MEKYEKVETILASLKASGGTQDQIDEVGGLRWSYPLYL